MENAVSGDERAVLLGMEPAELRAVAEAAGLPPFAGRQVAQWIYGKHVADVAQMTNLSKQGRARLAEAATVAAVRRWNATSRWTGR